MNDMKRIVSVLVVTFLLIMVSCDFLEVLPQDELTSELVFKTDDDFRIATNGIYVQLRDFYNNFWQFGDLRGDDVEEWALRSVERAAMDQFVIDVNSDILQETWINLYEVIRAANTILSKLEEADESIVNNNVQYSSEAKFLRALAYFHLVRIFGNVPLITIPISVEESKTTPQTSVNNIYEDLIIKDLLEVEKILPETYSSDNVGLPTKGAVKSLLGRVYLTRGNFDMAETKLMEVTNMGYALLDNWNDLWDPQLDEHHSEYIFDIEYTDGNLGIGSPFPLTFMYEDQDIGGSFVLALYEIYHFGGRHVGGGAGTPSEEFFNLFDSNDIRKELTAVNGIMLDGEFIVPTAQTPRITLKYLEDGYNFDITNNGKANWKVIRYADVLLMLAEALNENGKTTEALAYLNQVRSRAGVSEYSGLSQSETREMIYLERRFELYLEGHRWFDLVRTGRAFEVMESIGMKPHMTVFPIPQRQIDVVNDGTILSQNEGY